MNRHFTKVRESIHANAQSIYHRYLLNQRKNYVLAEKILALMKRLNVLFLQADPAAPLGEDWLSVFTFSSSGHCPAGVLQGVSYICVSWLLASKTSWTSGYRRDGWRNFYEQAWTRWHDSQMMDPVFLLSKTMGPKGLWTKKCRWADGAGRSTLGKRAH